LPPFYRRCTWVTAAVLLPAVLPFLPPFCVSRLRLGSLPPFSAAPPACTCLPFVSPPLLRNLLEYLAFLPAPAPDPAASLPATACWVLLPAGGCGSAGTCAYARASSPAGWSYRASCRLRACLGFCAHDLPGLPLQVRLAPRRAYWCHLRHLVSPAACVSWILRHACRLPPAPPAAVTTHLTCRTPPACLHCRIFCVSSSADAAPALYSSTVYGCCTCFWFLPTYLRLDSTVTVLPLPFSPPAGTPPAGFWVTCVRLWICLPVLVHRVGSLSACGWITLPACRMVHRHCLPAAAWMLPDSAACGYLPAHACLPPACRLPDWVVSFCLGSASYLPACVLGSVHLGSPPYLPVLLGFTATACTGSALPAACCHLLPACRCWTCLPAWIACLPFVACLPAASCRAFCCCSCLPGFCHYLPAVWILPFAVLPLQLPPRSTTCLLLPACLPACLGYRYHCVSHRLLPAVLPAWFVPLPLHRYLWVYHLFLPLHAACLPHVLGPASLAWVGFCCRFAGSAAVLQLGYRSACLPFTFVRSFWFCGSGLPAAVSAVHAACMPFVTWNPPHLHLPACRRCYHRLPACLPACTVPHLPYLPATRISACHLPLDAWVLPGFYLLFWIFTPLPAALPAFCLRFTGLPFYRSCVSPFCRCLPRVLPGLLNTCNFVLPCVPAQFCLQITTVSGSAW